MWTKESVDNIAKYVAENFSFDVNTIRLIREVLYQAKFMATIWAEPCAACEGKKPLFPFTVEEFLDNVFAPLNFNSREISAFAAGEIPSPQMVVVPVYATYKVGVKVWVEVPEGSGDDVIREATLEKIIGDGDYEIDESFDQQSDDVSIYTIDHDGVQYVEEDE